MNRQHIVLATLAVAAVLFAGAMVYQRDAGKRPTERNAAAKAAKTATNKTENAPAAATKNTDVANTRTGKPKSVAAKAPKLSAPFVRDHSPVLGPKDAPVTIIEFFDPACEACRAFHPVVKKIMNEFRGKVRLVLRYAAFHKQSDQAVRVLEAARKQGKFLPALEALLEDQPAWAPHGREGMSFWSFVSNAGVDISKAQEDMKDPKITQVLNTDAADIRELNVRQTPTFFVNGKPLEKFGAQPLFDLVKSEVEALD